MSLLYGKFGDGTVFAVEIGDDEEFDLDPSATLLSKAQYDAALALEEAAEQRAISAQQALVASARDKFLEELGFTAAEVDLLLGPAGDLDGDGHHDNGGGND